MNNEPIIHQHLYDRSRETTVSIKVSKNTKGYNWEISVVGAPTVGEALAMARDANEKLKEEYESPADS